MHIIIALDFSASERAFIDEVQTVLFALTERFELHPNSMRIGLISFNRGAQLILPLTGDTKVLEQTIADLRIPTRVFATDIHAALELARQQFTMRSLPSVPKYFVLVSDGDPHAHARGSGYQSDLILADSLKYGNPALERDPVHVFTLYSGETRQFRNSHSEWVRQASIEHMRHLATNFESFYFFEDYPQLVNLFEQISSCL
jgi:hypothetical protein